MSTRQIRRAAERKANNAAKAAYKAGLSSSQPDNHQDAEPIESEEELDTLIEEQRKDLQMARQLAQAKHEEAQQKAEQRQEAKQKAEREDEPKQKAKPQEPTTAKPPNPKGGPRTPEGKAISSLNNLKHGLTGSFRILDNERQEEFDLLLTTMIEDNQPETSFEFLLIEKMAAHIWLSRRAQRLQDCALTEDDLPRLGVYLRYQTTNDRGFDKCLSTFNRIKKERNGFESQEARVRLANAQALHLEVDAAIRQRCDIPTEGAFAIPFVEAQELFARCLIDTVNKLKDRKVA
jgi:hypothetical protein